MFVTIAVTRNIFRQQGIQNDAMIRSILFSIFLTVLSLTGSATLQAQTAGEGVEIPVSTAQTVAKATRFVVYYTGDAAKDLEDPNSYLRTFMDVYELQVLNTFETSEESKGFTLQPTTLLESANDTAKELSMIDGVMMIEIVYCKPNAES